MAWPCLTGRQAFLAKGGWFALSDDSHGVDQVGLNYTRVLDFVDTAGIYSLTYLQRGEKTTDERFPGISTSAVPLAQLRKHAFWT